MTQISFGRKILNFKKISKDYILMKITNFF